MITPAFRSSDFRPLFLGLAVSACGALCLCTLACGGKGGSPDANPDGAAGSSGSGAMAGAMSTGGIAASGSGGGVNPSAGVSAGGGAGAGAGGTASGGAPVAGAAAGGIFNGGASPTGPLEGDAKRPQVSATAAANYTVLKYFEKGSTVEAPIADNWDPTAGVGDVTALTPTYTVAASGGTDTTIQSAIDKAVAAGGTTRVAIEVADGTYREVACVPSGAPPITLYSKNPDATATRIVFNNYNGKPKDANTPANPCNPAIGSATYGTSGSPTFAAYANGFQAKNLTFENDTDETGIAANVQAVALATQGDKQIYENVRLLGNQDTFYAKSGAVNILARVYVTKSFIQGDTDFIFGRAVLVLDSTEIHFISSRQGSKGYAIVPSTDARNPFGILVTKCQFTADAATTAGSINLGRAWDESGKDLTTYIMLANSGVYPNGQALVRESTLGAHIRAADPWAPAATTSRPFSSVNTTAPANRMYEFNNTGPGAAPAK
jgi:pectinesterase